MGETNDVVGWMLRPGSATGYVDWTLRRWEFVGRRGRIPLGVRWDDRMRTMEQAGEGGRFEMAY